VAAVVLELDGRAVSRMTAPPWTRRVDFGREFSPHELVARALDGRGEEVARTRQWINLPRPPAETQILLERDAFGRAVAARLAWASLMGPEPERVSLTFDGRALALDADRRATLPPHDVAIAHVLTAQLDFANDVHSRNDLVLGGGSAGEAGSELTAVPVLAADRLLVADRLAGRFRRNGQPLEVVAVEHGPADVVLVRNLKAREAVQRLRWLVANRLPTDPTSLEKEDRLRILWPVSQTIVDVDAANVLFESSRVFSGEKFSLGSLLLRVEYPTESSAPRCFADAVAVAGLRAASGYSRRAVILVLGSQDRDESRSDPAAVRRYLERLRVPLFVWSLAGNGKGVPAAAWGEFDDVSSVATFTRAFDRFRKELARQSIVWLKGRHLPQEIALEGENAEVALVR